MTKLRIFALIGLFGCLVVTTGFAGDDTTELAILKARIDFGPRPGTDRLLVRAAFDPSLLVEGLDPGNCALSVTVGPEAVISLPPLTERDRLRSKRNGVWTFKRKATRTNRDSLKLRIHLGKGVMTLSGERLNLSEVRGLGAEEVSFSLSVAGATFSKTLEMGVKDSRWRYRYTGKGHGIGGGFPGGLPGGGGGGTGGAVAVRTLSYGSFPASSTFQAMVLRTEQAYSTEFRRRFPPPPPGMGMPIYSPPPVDFTMEMVVLIDLGSRSTGGYTVGVSRAVENGTGLLVYWQETRPGANCAVTMAITNPFVFVAVSRRDGAVSFTGSTVTKNCP
ncbi:MAG: protease complex subunit PrcB family protein [Planctomycetota bacterium]